MMKEKLPLFDEIKGMVNGSVLPGDELRLSKQCKVMYYRLLEGPATNVELQKLTSSLATSARRSDLRQELRRHGRDLVMQRSKSLPPGVNFYAIVDIIRHSTIQTGEK